MSQQRFVHSSGPRPVATKRQQTKYRPVEDDADAQNIMYDRRVVRGNTYSKYTVEENIKAIQERQTMEEKMRMRNQNSHKPTIFPQRSSTPPPVDGRNHMEIQTDTFLEELSDKPPEKEIDTQTDPLMDQPIPPLFIPTKSGVDAVTQIENNDLFDFDLEVQPILEVLVGKTLEMSMMEVMEEEELGNIRMHQEEFEQIRNVELAEVQRLEAEAKRRLQEKTRRVREEQVRRQARMDLEKKIAARSFSEAMLHDVTFDVFGRMAQDGHIYDPVQKEVETVFVPWLMNQVADGIAPVAASHAAMDELIRASIALSLERAAQAQAEQPVESLPEASPSSDQPTAAEVVPVADTPPADSSAVAPESTDPSAAGGGAA